MKTYREFRYRPQRGSLEESLEYQCSFSSLSDLFTYVAKVQFNGLITEYDISTRLYCEHDYQGIGWFNTHIVLVKHPTLGKVPAGFCSWHLGSIFGTNVKDEECSDEYI